MVIAAQCFVRAFLLLLDVLEEGAYSVRFRARDLRYGVSDGDVYGQVRALRPAFEENFCRASAVIGWSLFALVRDARIGEDSAEVGLYAEVPLPQAVPCAG